VNCRPSVESGQMTSKPASEFAPGSVWTTPAYGLDGVRHRGSAILFKALTLNCGNLRWRWEAKGTSLQGEADSSDASPRDGAARSSVETAVMAEKRRGGVIRQAWGDQPDNREESRMTCKSYDIPKTLIWEAWLHVRANQGAAGIDAETIERFEKKLGDNLYKLWNRMSSGSYFPPPVKSVPIPKKSGGVRILGIPTVADRIAQTVVKMWLEPRLDPIFCNDSYGYRPGKSALEAIAVTRRRCWDCDWVVEFDIRGLFDNLDHDLLMKALRKHCQEPWILLYVERWLKAPMQTTDGQMLERDKGTPQGGVVSPPGQSVSALRI
jgi:Reverse transcriptase (RNA-dependent DNA polymerase)